MKDKKKFNFTKTVKQTPEQVKFFEQLELSCQAKKKLVEDSGCYNWYSYKFLGKDKPKVPTVNQPNLIPTHYLNIKYTFNQEKQCYQRK